MNPVIAFVSATKPTTVVSRAEIVSDRDLELSEIYNVFMRPFDFWHAGLACLHRDETLVGPMSVIRERSQRPFEEYELQGLKRLALHISRAMQVYVRLRELEARLHGVSGMSSRALVALVLTDPFGRIAEANPLASAILAEGDGLVVRNGVLRATMGDDAASLARLVLEASGTSRRDSLGTIGALRISRPSGRRQLALVVARTRAADSPFGRSHAVSIAFSDPERTVEVDTDLVARLYGFTCREASVAALLAKGISPDQAALELAVSENTVRVHIRHMFCKVRVERLSDLVRILMQGPSMRGR